VHENNLAGIHKITTVSSHATHQTLCGNTHLTWVAWRAELYSMLWMSQA